MRTKNLIHPGEILLEEFLIPMGISQNRLSLNLQSNYDLGVAEAGVWGKIKKLIPEFMPARSAAVL